jgi:hypothetical protein
VSFKRPALLLVAFAFLANFALPIVSAQDANQQSGGSGLQLSPTRTELVAQPGEQKSFSLILKNVTASEVTAQVFLNDFQSDGNSGTPQIIVDETKDPTPYSLKNMLKDLKTVDLKPGETKEIKQVVDVPANTAPGAYFGALRYAAIPKGQSLNDAQRQVALTASVAHLVFVEVPGDINEQIQIEKAEAQRDGKGGSIFFKSPQKAAVTVKNKGNGFSRPFGRITINNAGGKEVHGYEINNTDPKGIVLPNSSRTFVDDAKNIKTPGKYTINAAVAYGNGGEVVTYKASFWYLPIWFLVLILLIVVAIGVGGYVLYRKRFVANKKRR